MIPQFYTTTEVAEKLQVEEDTVVAWIKARKLGAIKPSRHYRINQKHIDDFLLQYSLPARPAKNKKQSA